MYAHALRATIDAGEDYWDATKLIGNLWNKTYPGKIIFVKLLISPLNARFQRCGEGVEKHKNYRAP